MEIELTNNKGVVVIDDCDYDIIKNYHWHLAYGYGKLSFYAQTHLKINSKWTTIKMHQLIMGSPVGKIDHINHNGLDNRRCNLRICTSQQNSMNARKTTNLRSSIYKGVCWVARRGTWNASIRKNRTLIFIGRFVTEIEAAIAYDNKAVELFGEFACLNFTKSVA